ncbi:hypothetical protein Pmar_PMAR012966 [Perkinsus marinus ATCC 50983]|uniref:Uncharacterized protein n=1 Tax=Perkinsus marinus (strain ATCC 50983 / TXsc) TaxID=423536 RepID=C5L5E4_PERM5|nr:hypothetical protein Pmar_PMAR012966 [Perkinsus marinus ATCC 50983]EER08049.1 hypothetical protein Pmar_PMAR012966 [Perkinsus marinus ATCC 50983]|eukprot:XP_002776233.1 hypothetical protein Pmar_PMAR012966 [Perkinsus marinus ATCC 50983]
MPSVKVPLPPLKSVFGDAFQQCKNGPEVLTLVSKTAIPLSYGDACHALTHLANFGDFKRGSRDFKDFITKLDTQVCMPWFEKVLPQCEPHRAIDVLYRLYRISGVHVK